MIFLGKSGESSYQTLSPHLNTMEKLIKQHIGLVLKIADKYKKEAPLEDLIGAGVRGLVLADKLHKKTKSKHKFTTYSCWFIANSMDRLLGIGEYKK